MQSVFTNQSETISVVKDGARFRNSSYFDDMIANGTSDGYMYGLEAKDGPPACPAGYFGGFEDYVNLKTYWFAKDYQTITFVSSDSKSYNVKIAELKRLNESGAELETKYGTVLVDNNTSPTTILAFNMPQDTYDAAVSITKGMYEAMPSSTFEKWINNTDGLGGYIYGLERISGSNGSNKQDPKLDDDSKGSSSNSDKTKDEPVYSNPYAEACERFLAQIKNAKGDITIDMGNWTSLPDWVMKSVAERRDINITIRFRVKGKTYEVVVPKGKKIVLDAKIKYYGYLKLNDMFKMKEVVAK